MATRALKKAQSKKVTGHLLPSEFMSDHKDDSVTVTRSEVEAALQMVAGAYPELDRTMQVAKAMLVHMDSLRDHAQLGIDLARNELSRGTSKNVITNLESASQTLGDWNRKYTLYLH